MLMKKLLIATAVVALVPGGWYAYTAIWSGPAAPNFQTAEIARASIVSSVSATGTIEPIVKVLVGSQVSGTVVRWFADFNQPVAKNFILAQLDQDRYKRTL